MIFGPKEYGLYKGPSRISPFSRAGWKGSRVAIRFSKMSFMMHCHFEKRSQNQHFQSNLLVGREEGTKKSILCTLLIMLTILDDP